MLTKFLWQYTMSVHPFAINVLYKLILLNLKNYEITIIFSNYKPESLQNEEKAFVVSMYSLYLLYFYPTVLNGCRGIVFTHGIRMGMWAGYSLSGLYLRNHKV